MPFAREALASVCTHEPELGAVVLTRPLPDTPAKVWVSPVSFEDIRPAAKALRLFASDHFYVYSCDALR